MSDLVKWLREAYGEVSCFPEAKHNGFMLLLELRNLVPEAADRIEQLTNRVNDLERENERLRDGVKFVLDNSSDMSNRDRMNLEMYLSNKEALK